MPNHRQWLELPECPSCGAIQPDPGTTESSLWTLTCHACQQRFELRVVVTRQYRATPIDDERPGAGRNEER